MAENERQKLKVNEELIGEFISGRLQPSIETRLVTYFKSRPELIERLAEPQRSGLVARLLAVQQRASQAARALRAGLPPALANYAGYEVTRELGRGGMGVVYLAKNIPMDRLEVLKVLNERLLDHPGAKERFLREIRAVSKLNHPNIVTSYSVLPLENLLVFVMEHVPGVDLQQFIRTYHPLSIDQCCAFARQLALGLQHAHSKGLVHRDIKPSNAIVYKLDNRLQLKILDFGLAKATSEEASTNLSQVQNLTQDGTLLGTPEYMSPEQSIDPARADIRADIYSLGCTLYHMLTGRPPFTGSHGSVLIQHAQNVAQPVNMLRPEVPVELVAVLDKMLAKQPAKRFQTPQEVATALLPFMKGDNHAVQVSQSTSSTSLDLTSPSRDTSVVDVSLQLAEGTDEPPARERARVKSVAIESPSMDEIRLQPLQPSNDQATQIKVHSTPIHRMTGAAEHDSPGSAWQRNGLWGVPVIGGGLVVTALVLWQLGGWITQTLQSGWTSAIGATEGTAGTTEPPAVWRDPTDDTAVKPPVVETAGTASTSDAAKSPPVVVASSSVVAPPELQNVDTAAAARKRRTLLNQARLQDNSEPGAELVRQLQAARWPVDLLDRNNIAYEELFAAGRGDFNRAPPELVGVLGNSRWKCADMPMATDTSIDGKTVVSGEVNGTVTIWDPVSGRMRAQFKSSDADLYHLKLNRAGTRLLTSGSDGIIRLWEVSPPSLVRSFVGHQTKVISAVFSAEENRVYSVDESKKLIIWDAFTATRKHTVDLPETPHESAAHPSLERVVVGCNAGKVVIVDTAEPKIIEEITLGKDRISSVDYSPDGKLVAASLGDGDVHVWEADKKYQQLRKKTVPHAPLNSVHFSRDSKFLAVGARWECWFWDQAQDTMDLHHATHADVSDVVPLGDGWLVSWSESHWMAVVDRRGRLLNSGSAPITGATLAPDGTTVAVTVRDAEQTQLWKFAQQLQLRALPGQTQWDNAIGYAIDGQNVYTAGGNWFIRTWDVDSGLRPGNFGKHENWILGLDVAADGKQLCTCGWDKSARIWDIQSGKLLHKLSDHGQGVPQCRYSPDSTKLATACWDGTARVWNTASGSLITSLPKAEGNCRAIAFQPFSENLAATSKSNVRLYSITDGTLVRTFSGHESIVFDVDFTLDGKRMVSCANDGTVRVWDSQSGQPVKAISLHPRRGRIESVRFSYDGRHVLALTGNGLVYVLRL